MRLIRNSVPTGGNIDVEIGSGKAITQPSDRLIVIGSGDGFEENTHALSVANKYSNVYCTLGFHPHEAKDMTEDQFFLLSGLIADNAKVVGIGETGLDYHYMHSPKNSQQAVFACFVALAGTVKKPLVALASRDINRLKNELLFLQQQKLPKQEIEQRKKKLLEKKERCVKVLTLFNKVGIRTKLSDLSKEEIRILKNYVQEIIQSAVGGMNVTTTVEGRERYSVNVRYARDFRDDVDKLGRVLVTAENGVNVPLAQIADIEFKQGPAMIRDENGLLSGYVYVDIDGVDVGTYVKEAKKLVASHLKLPAGYTLQWSGQYENMLRVRERLKLVLPLTAFLIFLLIYMNTKSAVKTSIVLLAVPFSLIGAVWLVYLLGYNMSIAVWVGMIALMGLDAETGVFMLLYLDLAYDDMKKKGLLKTAKDLEEAVVHGAVRRVRPKLMTVAAAFMGLVPIMWALGTGSDVMKRIAAPMIGGLFSSFALELLVYPVVFYLWKQHEMKKEALQ